MSGRTLGRNVLACWGCGGACAQWLEGGCKGWCQRVARCPVCPARGWPSHSLPRHVREVSGKAWEGCPDVQKSTSGLSRERAVGGWRGGPRSSAQGLCGHLVFMAPTRADPGGRRGAGAWGGGPVVRGQGPSFSSLRPLTAVWFSFRQLMAQEPLEKLGFGDLIDGKSETKTKF